MNKINNSSTNRYSFIFHCPVCYKKERIEVYKEEIEQSKDKLKTIVIYHRDADSPHEISITVDINGHIRNMYIHMLDRMESIPLKYFVSLKIYPIVIKPNAIKAEKNELTRRILELSNGFNTIDDIASELSVEKLTVIEKLGELKRKGKIALTYTIYISSEEVIE